MMIEYAVIGLGTFGMVAAREMAREGLGVVAVDRDAEAVRVAQEFVELALVADVSKREGLGQLPLKGVRTAVLALGENRYESLQAILNLKAIGVTKVIVKVTGEEHGRIASKVGADQVIFPEKELAERLASRLAMRNVLEVFSLGSGVNLIELGVPASLVGKKLSESELGKRFKVRVVAIKEFVPERMHFLPDPDHMLKDSDILLVTGEEANLQKLRGL